MRGRGGRGDRDTEGCSSLLEGFAITVHILRVHRVIGTVGPRAAIGGKEDRNRIERNGILQFWSKWTNNIISFSIR